MSHKTKLFGTDGIRGRVNRSPMTPETVLRVGMAIAYILKNRPLGEHGRNTVLIGKDTRLSGYMMEAALQAGFTSVGMDVTLLGPYYERFGIDCGSVARRIVYLVTGDLDEHGGP
mgnify:CR=1 FL=1